MAFVFNCVKCGREVYARNKNETPRCAYCNTTQSVPDDVPEFDGRLEAVPPMPRITSCFRCNSTTIIPDVRIIDRGEGKKDLTAEVYRKPDALLFKGTATSSLRAWICASCGYTEIYATNTTALKAAYDEMQQQAAETIVEPTDPELLGRLSVSTSTDEDGQLSLTHEVGGLMFDEDEDETIQE